MEILDVKDLSFTYPGSGSPTLQNISFSVKEGEFIVLCGATGSGKSTLLRMLKPQLSPLGDESGAVSFRSQNIRSVPASDIGFVIQSPDHQTVTDKVWHELAFGLENMGVPQSEMSRKTAEISSYFGISDLFDKNISELSGGQKQIINLASVMVTSPKLLILDEPTAQLDPIAASDLINTVKKLNFDLSLTVIIAEHRLEELIPICDRLLVIENGSVAAFGRPKDVLTLIGGKKDIMCGMPAAARISALTDPENPALTIKEGRDLVQTFGNKKSSGPEPEPGSKNKKAALCFKDVFFRYERNTPDILKGLTFEVYESEILCILGGNGSGKSTALSAAAGILRPYSGSITVFGQNIRKYKNQSLYNECIALLPQDVQTVFLRNSVREELEDSGIDAGELPYDLTALLDKHPYDLSGGEQQLTALAKVLALKPKILMLDEPTKGLDASSKQIIIKLLRKLSDSGMTIVTVTHDVEFAAECADRCALFFRGEIISTDTPELFFSGNDFYTTAASRITRGHYKNTVTVDETVRLCLLNGKKEENDDND